MTTLIPENLVGKRYEDAFGRSLKVISVHPGDVHGREVRGRIRSDDLGTQDFATTMKIFDAYFIKKIVPSNHNKKVW
jgi:hypothetical protein